MIFINFFAFTCKSSSGNTVYTRYDSVTLLHASLNCNCKRITFSCIFFLAFWQKAVSAKSNTSVNAMHICIRIGASRNKLIQSTLNCLKIKFRQI